MILTEFLQIPHGSWEWLFRSSWQASVLIGLVLVIQSILGNKLAPRWRHTLWALVLIRLALPVSPESAFSIFNFARITAQPAPRQTGDWSAETSIVQPVHNEGFAAVPSEGAHGARLPVHPAPPGQTPLSSVSRELFSWSRVVPLLWLGGVVLLLARLFIGHVRLTHGIRRSRIVNDSTVLVLLEQCRAQMRVARTPRVVETEMVGSPALCGIWRPCLLFPPGMLGRFRGRELRHVFLHELAHMQRRDIVINWLAMLLTVLHWFNPLVWLAFARLRADSDLACDALALSWAEPHERNAYGRTILKLLESATPPSPRNGLARILENKRLPGVPTFFCPRKRPWFSPNTRKRFPSLAPP